MNKLTAEKCREQFEEWLKSTGQNPPYATKRGYWEIWKASREALEIALPILELQDRDEGEWIEWGGRSIPRSVRGRTVQVRYACGETTTEYSGFLNWGDGVGKAVIAYRIIPERATNQNGEQ